MLRSKFVKCLVSILNWQVNSSSNFPSVFIFKTHNSPINFKFIHFLLWIKRSHQSSNFKTFGCSGENLPNSSCDFPNHKSVFFQTLHHSPVSKKLTPLYFFRSNVIYFARKIPIKVQIFEKFFAKFCTLMGSFCPNHIKFQLRKYRRVISHDTEDWSEG